MLDGEVGHVDFLTSSVSLCASTPLHGILNFVCSVPRYTCRDKIHVGLVAWHRCVLNGY